MNKKHVVRLTASQREIVQKVIDRLDSSPRKVKRAQILLKADEETHGWTDKQIANAFGCTTQTVENVRQRFCESGFEVALSGKQRQSPPRQRKFDGDAEAQVIALRLSDPPAGYANWTLSLLQERVVALSIVDSVSRETLRTTLKKWDDAAKDSVLGHSSERESPVRCQHGKRASGLQAAIRPAVSDRLHG